MGYMKSYVKTTKNYRADNKISLFKGVYRGISENYTSEVVG